MLDIAEVVEATGLAPSALRFYERRGLLSSSARNGLRRMYDADVIDRVALIVAARDAGFELREIAELLGASDEPSVRAALAAKVVELDARIDRLVACGTGCPTVSAARARRCSSARTSGDICKQCCPAGRR